MKCEVKNNGNSCSQHFEYGSNYGHVTFGIKLIKLEAVSQVKKLIIYGGPGQIYRWRIILLLMNSWLIANS